MLTSAEFEQASGFFKVFERDVRPQLASSRLAPVLLTVGAYLPYVGRDAKLPQVQE